MCEHLLPEEGKGKDIPSGGKQHMQRLGDQNEPVVLKDKGARRREGAAWSHSGTSPPCRRPWAPITRAASSGATPQEPSPWLALAGPTAVFESSWQPAWMVGCM